MKKRAISLITFQRENYLKETLESWRNARGIENYDFYIFIDRSENLQNILDVANNFKKTSLFNVYITVNKIGQQGNWRNSFNAINSIINRYEFVILAEDDVIVSNDSLEYFDYLIPIYQDSEDIISISANYVNDNAFNDNSVFVINGFSGLVWGTWPKWWNKILKTAWSIPPENGIAWDEVANLIVRGYDLRSVVPAVSRSQHIGKTGYYSDPEIYKTSYAKRFKLNNRFISPIEFRAIPVNGSFTNEKWEERKI
jgi:hypothetical protein